MIKNKNSLKDSIIIGTALFAMFFGAGNLIFPPFLGLNVGDQFTWALLGFLCTGVGMPVLGIIAVAKAGGTFELASKVSPLFGKILITVIVLAIGPLLAIPRTAATTYEVGVVTLIPNASSIISSIIFFLLTFILVYKPSSIVDNIGRYLTPVLFIILLLIIVNGIINPMGYQISKDLNKNSFAIGFTEGYQTMDAIGSIVVAIIIINAVRAKGYSNSKDIIKVMTISCLISAFGLAFVYGGLMYLGSLVSSELQVDISRTDLLVEITKLALGNFGAIALSICVAVACLTTSVALTAMFAETMEIILKNKFNYIQIVLVTIIFSAIVSNYGVTSIVKFAIPLLLTVYPVVITIILMSFFENTFKLNNSAYKGGAYVALIAGLIDSLSYLKLDFSWYYNLIPVISNSFAWIIPVLIGITIGKFFSSKDKIQK